jgi:hypothetical protein
VAVAEGLAGSHDVRNDVVHLQERNDT